jgi:hypothetical protein
MKKLAYFKVILVATLVCVIFLSVTEVTLKTTEDLSGTNIRATVSDTVWVLLNHIKPDKCEQFEKFIHEIFWPKADKLNAADQQAFKQTRVLHPVEMNKDSTYTYVFLMDPVIPHGNYRILYYLKKMYDEEKAKEYYKMWDECYKSPQVGYVVIQSQY